MRTVGTHVGTMSGPIFCRYSGPSACAIRAPLPAHALNFVVIGQHGFQPFSFPTMLQGDHSCEKAKSLFAAEDFGVPSGSVLGVVVVPELYVELQSHLDQNAAHEIEQFLIRISETDITGRLSESSIEDDTTLAVDESGDIGSLFGGTKYLLHSGYVRDAELKNKDPT